MTTQKISLIQFYSELAVLNGFNHIPKFHVRILKFLEDDQQWTNNTAVLQSFRNSAKSSLAAVYAVWLLVKDPTLLILIQSADDATAMKLVEDAKRIINTHPRAAHLRSKNKSWTAKKVVVRGSTSGRNSSLEARGIFSNVTGSRADYIIFDDTEVPRNANSPDIRERLRSRIAESHHLLNPNGKKLFIGTPHSFESIYPELISKGASSLLIPLLTNIKGEFPFLTGTITWPERWNEEEILAKQVACKSKAEFFSQYQLIPISSVEAVLNPGQIITYDKEVETFTANKASTMMLGDVRIRAVSVYWDVATNSKRSDDSVLAIVYLGFDGHLYIHRLIELLGPIEQQCRQVKKAILEFKLAKVDVETNGVGYFAPNLLLKEVRGLGVAVNGVHTQCKKSDKIMEAFDVPISANMVHAHQSVMSTKFVQQMRDFNPNRLIGKDDFIDAAASAIKSLPITVGRGITNAVDGFTAWRPHGDTVEVQREYA